MMMPEDLEFIAKSAAKLESPASNSIVETLNAQKEDAFRKYIIAQSAQDPNAFLYEHEAYGSYTSFHS